MSVVLEPTLARMILHRPQFRMVVLDPYLAAAKLFQLWLVDEERDSIEVIAQHAQGLATFLRVFSLQ